MDKVEKRLKKGADVALLFLAIEGDVWQDGKERGEGNASKGSNHAAQLREHEAEGFLWQPDVMCEELDADRQEIEGRLESVGYHYDAERNQFI